MKINTFKSLFKSLTNITTNDISFPRFSVLMLNKNQIQLGFLFKRKKGDYEFCKRNLKLYLEERNPHYLLQKRKDNYLLKSFTWNVDSYTEAYTRTDFKIIYKSNSAQDMWDYIMLKGFLYGNCGKIYLV
jgi:hypothetical protein